MLLEIPLAMQGTKSFQIPIFGFQKLFFQPHTCQHVGMVQQRFGS